MCRRKEKNAAPVAYDADASFYAEPKRILCETIKLLVGLEKKPIKFTCGESKLLLHSISHTQNYEEVILNFVVAK